MAACIFFPSTGFLVYIQVRDLVQSKTPQRRVISRTDLMLDLEKLAL